MRHRCRELLVLFALSWLLAVTLPALAQSDPPIEAFAPVAPEAAAIEIRPVDALSSASSLQPSAKCHPTQYRASLVALRWQPAAGEGVSAQRVDISKFRTGFDNARFDTTRQLPASSTGVSVEAPEPGLYYYWRVLTHSPGGWTTSSVARFEVPICPWDEPDRPSAGTARSSSPQAGPDQTDKPSNNDRPSSR